MKNPIKVRKSAAGRIKSLQPLTARPPPIVGIGASAGGLEAFTQLLKSLPADTGMAFVLVQHLAPQHESILPHLLRITTLMPVQEATHNLSIRKNRVYVIPPNRTMGLKGGKLTLKNRRSQGLHHPIDLFLRALASEKGEGAIGVILSGTANDGTLGLEAIKEAGGITFAQDDSAKYDSMPISAVASGAVDFVLSPKKIADELARISKHPYVRKTQTIEVGKMAALEANAEPPASEGAFNGILGALWKPYGVDFKLYKAGTVQRRIERRMVLSQKGSVQEYERFLSEDSRELEALYGDLLIHVTSFFRDPEAFEVLKERVFPELTREKSNEPVRVWTLGCSTGQEAYSIAIAYAEFVSASEKRMPGLQVFATDLNGAHLEKGRQGLYSKSLMQNVSPERKTRFFAEEENGFRVSKALREMCVFARQNVLSDPPFSRIDLISCRNLLIYFEPALQKKIIPSLHYALNPKGFLFLGASESMAAFPDLFEMADRKQKIFTKKGARTMGFQLPVSPGIKAANSGQGLTEKIRGGLPAEIAALREADRLSVNRYAPPGVVVNEKLQIIQFRGKTDAFLEPPTGKASFDLLKMARGGLTMALRSAIDDAQKSGLTVRRGKVDFKLEGKPESVDLEVIPMNNLKERCCLISFELQKEQSAGYFKSRKREEMLKFKVPPRMEPAEEASELARTLEKLEQAEHELLEMRDYVRVLQEHHEAASEELQSTNEEAQSGNEELQSINEELATSKEELESSNEELITLNEEMTRRSGEVAELNVDLNNLFLSLNLPVLLLGKDLGLRRFTPAAEELFGLTARDVGRNFADLRPALVYENLLQVTHNVIEKGIAQEREAQDRNGRWQHVRVHPYLAANSQIEGAVVVITDIDALKRSVQEIKNGKDYVEAILRTGRHPVLVLRSDLRVDTVNEAFSRTFKLQPAQVRGRSVFEIGKGAWNTPKLRTLLKDILPRNSFFNDFEALVSFPGVGKRTLLLNARRLEWDHARDMILFSIEDITERLESRAAMKLSELRYRRLFEAAQDGILMIDPISRLIIDANPYMSELLGYPREYFIGKELVDIGLLENKAASKQAFRELQQDRYIRLEHVHLKTAQGNPRDVEFIGNLYRQNGDEVIQCNLRNITARKRVESALRESEARYRNLFESIDEGFCVVEVIFDETGVGIDQRYLEVNPAFERHSGLKNSVGKTARELIPDFEPSWSEALGKVAMTGDSVRLINEVKGLNRWFEVYAVRLHARAPGKVAVLFNDITERRRIEESLRIAQELLADHARELEVLVTERTEQLRETVAELHMLTYTIAHNLRGPLRGINGMCQALAEDYGPQLDATGKDFTARAAASAVRMDGLIRDLLTYTKMMKTEAPTSATNLNKVVKAALERAEFASAPHGVKVKMDVPADFPDVLAHAPTLGMALDHLLSNALKFTKEGSSTEIRIHATNQNKRVRLCVQDAGIGIPEEHLKRIFGVFERLKPDESSGTGIGLAIVDRAIRRMGGTCGAESQYGQGSLFWIELAEG